MTKEKNPLPIPAPGREEPQLSESTIVYVQTVYWVSAYVKAHAKKSGLTHDQLIEEFGVNVRRTIDPEWRPDA